MDSRVNVIAVKSDACGQESFEMGLQQHDHHDVARKTTVPAVGSCFSSECDRSAQQQGSAPSWKPAPRNEQKSPNYCSNKCPACTYAQCKCAARHSTLLSWISMRYNGTSAKWLYDAAPTATAVSAMDHSQALRNSARTYLCDTNSAAVCEFGRDYAFYVQAILLVDCFPHCENMERHVMGRLQTAKTMCQTLTGRAAAA
eukprot:12657-Heterococcus_DN1.PRE.1